MTIHHICLVDRSGRLLVSYYLTPATPLQQDRWEGTLSSLILPSALSASFTGDVALVYGDRFILLRGTADIVFILSGSGLHDELGLIEPLEACIECVRETCDRTLTPEKVLSFHGKIRTCLQEQFLGGDLINTDVETVLRSAKLKPLKA